MKIHGIAERYEFRQDMTQSGEDLGAEIQSRGKVLLEMGQK